MNFCFLLTLFSLVKSVLTASFSDSLDVVTESNGLSSKSLLECLLTSDFTCARTLIARGDVDLSERDSEGNTALYYAILKDGPINIIKSLKPSIDSNTPELNHKILELLAIKGNFEKFLIIISSDFFKTTQIPFSEAIISYIEKQIDNYDGIHDEFFYTPIEIAIRSTKFPAAIKTNKRIQVSRYNAFKNLYQKYKRTNPRFKNPILLSYLKHSNSGSELEIVKLFIKDGVNYNEEKNGESALLVAIEAGLFDIAEYLFQELHAYVNYSSLVNSKKFWEDLHSTDSFVLDKENIKRKLDFFDRVQNRIDDHAKIA